MFLGLVFCCVLLFPGCDSAAPKPDYTLYKSAYIDTGAARRFDVEIESIIDYGDQFQITAKSGKIILAPKSIVTLIS